MKRLVESLRNRVIVITGASRGIGTRIALKCARDGAHTVILARSGTKTSHKALTGTLSEVADEIRVFGGSVLPVETDLRDTDAIRKAIETTVHQFGRIDAIVNNASAISVENMPQPKQYDVIMDVNTRASANMILHSHAYLDKSDLRHILTISPPLRTLSVKWLTPHPVYSVSKYGMTMLTLGYSDNYRANTIWPKKLIATAAT